jgi:cytoskeleton protein RodZ
VATFGEELRRVREGRGIAVEAICNTTKVPAKHIRALEAGELAELPGGVFRRGMVRSYLHALGLEETVWMKRFEVTCAENVKNSRAKMVRRARIRGAGLALLVLILGVAGWCGWRLATHRRVLPLPMIWSSPKSWVDNGSSR